MIKKTKSKIKKNPKIGLALGGGTVRGMAFIGILKVFQEEGIKNCETMHIEIESNVLTGKFRGKEVDL